MVLQNILEEQSTGVMVVPKWPTQPWWPHLMRMLYSDTSGPAQIGAGLISAHQTRAGTSVASEISSTDLSPLRRPFENKGPSEQALSLIMTSWRKSTQRQYISYHKKWQQYCSSRQINRVSATVEDRIHFLAELYHSGSGYSVLNTARSALSYTIILPDRKTF